MADFQDIKRRFSIEKTAELLGLTLKPASGGLRGPCPACDRGGERALAITPNYRHTDGSTGAYYCFQSKAHGDCIELVAHIKGIEIKDAADWLAGPNRERRPGTVPSKKGTVPEGFHELDYLEGDHPAVHAIGFDPAIVERIGLGYCPKGILRGSIAIPIRDRDGTLLGYIGIEDCKVPGSLATNVTPLRKPA